MIIFSAKKGVSPLIATVLLIAFAVALGAVVMNWGRDYVETTAKDSQDKSNLELSCQQDISLGVKEISNIPKICYDQSGKYVEAMLENKGRTTITGLKYTIFDDSDGVYSAINETITITAGGVTNMVKFNHTFNTTAEILQVEFIPMIKPKGSTTSQYCSRTVLIADDIPTCD